MINTISQKLLDKNGFTPCGMCFNASGPESGKEYSKDVHRLHAGFCVRILDKKTRHLLYLPDECANYVKDVFFAAGMSFSIQAASQPSTPATIPSYKFDAFTKALEIRIDRIGADLREKIKWLQSLEGSEQVQVVMVYLNMNDPACPLYYPYFCDIDFLFAGCLPGSAAGS